MISDHRSVCNIHLTITALQVHNCSAWKILASCLTNVQPILAHRPAAEDNSLIGCTSHELTDDWSLASTHFVTASMHFGARLGAFFYRTRFI